jgi:predicted nicotinamide N-methyase
LNATPGYLTKQERIAVDGVDDLLIRSLLDRQQFFDPRRQAEKLGISSAMWPIFGLLWPSGTFLAARLAARPVREGERILEAGCGLGLLVGHRRGADVTASDKHPLSASFLHHNARLNDLAPIKYRHGPWSGGSAGRHVEGSFDLIIGSDLLYDRDASGTLGGFIGRHAAAAAEVWIVDPDRGNRRAFNRQMLELGFSLHEQRLDHAAAIGLAAYKGRMLTYSRPA